MAVQMLVFEGDWSVYESTPPTPDHTPANGVEPSLKIRVMKMGFQAAITHKGLQFQFATTVGGVARALNKNGCTPRQFAPLCNSPAVIE